MRIIYREEYGHFPIAQLKWMAITIEKIPYAMMGFHFKILILPENEERTLLIYGVHRNQTPDGYHLYRVYPDHDSSLEVVVQSVEVCGQPIDDYILMA